MYARKKLDIVVALKKMAYLDIAKDKSKCYNVEMWVSM